MVVFLCFHHGATAALPKQRQPGGKGSCARRVTLPAHTRGAGGGTRSIMSPFILYAGRI